MAAKNDEAGTDDRELVITRVFDVPREMVFKAWTEPQQALKWWGPRGFTVPHHEFDLRPGGRYRVCMRAPDGSDHWQTGIYGEVVEPERFSFSFAWEDAAGKPGHETQVTVTFVDEDGKTKMTLRQGLFKSKESRDGHQDGWSQSLDRLGEFVAGHSSNAQSQFSISRTFDAPRDLVFQAWTEPERLKHWFGPKGFTMLACSGEFRPGGVFLYGMKAPAGNEMWGKWVFREIVAPERLVFVQSFSDAAGGTTRHPFAPVWPLETLSTITFTEAAGKTTITLAGLPIHASDAERKAFIDAFKGMQQGWTGTLDQLADYLAKARE